MARVAAPLSAKLCALLENNRFKAFRLEITRCDDPTWARPNHCNSLHWEHLCFAIWSYGRIIQGDDRALATLVRAEKRGSRGYNASVRWRACGF